MHRYLLIVIALFCALQTRAQIGINTTTPLGVLHIDSKGDTSGSVTSATNVSDDIVVSDDGYLGIGTVNPPSKLSVVGTGTDTGLQLTNGAASGYVLSSDADGNASWKSPTIQYQTFVSNTTATDLTLTANSGQVTPISSFNYVLLDTTKDNFGTDYGWNSTSQQYKAPKTGLYRITSQIYFQPNSVGTGYRSGWMLNGNTAPKQAIGFYAFVDNGSPVTAYSSNVYQLNKDDILKFGVVYANSSGSVTVKIRLGTGYTFIIIELLK